MKGVVHIHTNYSRCSNIEPEELLKRCLKRGLEFIAITDHDTIEGALHLRRLAEGTSLKVIIGEEISTRDGDIIGLFLNSPIYAKDLQIESVIDKIKEQGGLVMLPHPFDFIRKEALRDKEKIEKIFSKLDFFEVFNSRSKVFGNKLADEFYKYSKDSDVLPIYGSDAHFLYELSGAIVNIPDFEDSKSFKNSYRNMNIIRLKQTGFHSLILSKLRKMTSKR